MPPKIEQPMSNGSKPNNELELGKALPKRAPSVAESALEGNAGE